MFDCSLGDLIRPLGVHCQHITQERQVLTSCNLRLENWASTLQHAMGEKTAIFLVHPVGRFDAMSVLLAFKGGSMSQLDSGKYHYSACYFASADPKNTTLHSELPLQEK